MPVVDGAATRFHGMLEAESLDLESYRELMSADADGRTGEIEAFRSDEEFCRSRITETVD